MSLLGPGHQPLARKSCAALPVPGPAPARGAFDTAPPGPARAPSSAPTSPARRTGGPQASPAPPPRSPWRAGPAERGPRTRRRGREGGLGSPEEGKGRAAEGAGEGRAGRGGTRRGRAGLRSLQPPHGSRGAGGRTRDPARRRRARRGPRTNPRAPRLRSSLCRLPPRPRGPRLRGARSRHPSEDAGSARRPPGAAAPARGLGGRRPAEPEVGAKVSPGVAGGVEGRGSACLGTEGLSFAEVERPSRQGLCRSGGPCWGVFHIPQPNARSRSVRGADGTGQPGSHRIHACDQPSVTPPLPCAPTPHCVSRDTPLALI